jgi:hypothetical protein
MLLSAILAISVLSCEDEEAPLTTEITISGKVSNISSEAGKIIVEFDNYLRDVADLQGNFVINVHRDTYVDSLYAWVDVNLDNRYTAGEPLGAYPSGFQINNTNVTDLDFTIP